MLDRLLTVDGWILFGLLGQACFTSRFLVQWVASERSGRSMVPHAFWWFSLVGGSILLIYALWYRHDLVFTLGQAAGLVVYVRNLALIRRAAEAAPVTQGVAGPGA
ncbi:MAG TPA: lipid-A-disaccharide synthase N-terminal domain-containing protein [Candidatus Polarisedimenticolia bacterium]|nr:lipid-A-disaccharide synthase N-terminal domain-containing protein [Candidatus Polarisedimenticolia bacterium]